MNNWITGQRLNKLLKANEMTYDDMHEKTGLAKGTINKIVKGHVTSISSDTLLKISECFNVSTDYLLGVSDVSSVDVKIKEISSITKLSEESINKLQRMNECNIYNDKLDILNQIIESDKFRDLLSKLWYYFTFVAIGETRNSYYELSDTIYQDTDNSDEKKFLEDVGKCLSSIKLNSDYYHEQLINKKNKLVSRLDTETDENKSKEIQRLINNIDTFEALNSLFK